jgi:hypothetical protein
MRMHFSRSSEIYALLSDVAGAILVRLVLFSVDGAHCTEIVDGSFRRTRWFIHLVVLGQLDAKKMGG